MLVTKMTASLVWVAWSGEGTGDTGWAWRILSPGTFSVSLAASPL